jgi:hypothetical protein
MAMIRPEVYLAFLRWRDVLAGLALVALGIYWGLGTGLLGLVGWPVAVIGVALAFTGLQRGALIPKGHGEGVVRLVEGQLGYFGPEQGGVVDVAEIASLSRHGNTWVIVGRDGTRLEIPLDAEGVEVLFDVFAMLPGLDMRVIVRSARQTPGEEALLWQRPTRRLH